MWRRADLYYKLHKTQRKIYDAIRASKAKRHFLCCSRRLGKSFMLVCLAFEQALRKPGSRIVYLAPWAKDAADIVKDAADKILPDCPFEFRPSYAAQAKEFIFRNGSIIRFRGVNGEHGQFLRGGAADLVVLDECGLMDDLGHVVNDVVTPMTLTTDGTVILATTPARTPDHESKPLCDESFREGCGYEFTLLDAPHMTPEQKSRALKSAGEKDEDIPAILAGTKLPVTTTAQREYFCKWVTDAKSAVVPEFDAKAKAEIVTVWDRPPHFDAYVSMDPGYVDKTGILFAFWDARAGKLIIEDECLLSHAGTPEIAEAIRKKEGELWGDKQPYMRISDIEKRLISDLTAHFGLPFSPALKNDSKGSVWRMRQLVANRTLVIHPKCVNLIRQLENAIWNKRASDFEHEVAGADSDEIPGHFDLVASLKYLCRMIDMSRNPYPKWYDDLKPGQTRGARHPKKADLGLRADTPLARKLAKRGL